MLLANSLCLPRTPFFLHSYSYFEGKSEIGWVYAAMSWEGEDGTVVERFELSFDFRLPQTFFLNHPPPDVPANHGGLCYSPSQFFPIPHSIFKKLTNIFENYHFQKIAHHIFFLYPNPNQHTTFQSGSNMLINFANIGMYFEFKFFSSNSVENLWSRFFCSIFMK